MTWLVAADFGLLEAGAVQVAELDSVDETFNFVVAGCMVARLSDFDRAKTDAVPSLDQHHHTSGTDSRGEQAQAAPY